MKFDEFMESTQKLCELYGKNLNQTQVEFWFESVKSYDLIHYQMAINKYAKQNKYMPTISDLLTEIKMAKQINPIGQEQQAENKPKVPCDKCHGSGLVKYYRHGYEYLCTCNCQNGKALDIPLLKKFDDVFSHVDNQFNFSIAR